MSYEAMKAGDRVRLIAIPSDEDDPAMRSTLEMCLGHDFTVTAVNEIGSAEIEIDSITGISGDKVYIPAACFKML
jgi:hypothetical protein